MEVADCPRLASAVADGEARGGDAVAVMVETAVALDTATSGLEAEAVVDDTTALRNQNTHGR